FGAISCSVKLINAASDAEKISFRTLNRKDRLPVRSVYVDEITGDVVDGAKPDKGYELAGGDYLLVEPEDIKNLKPANEHALEIDQTVDLASIDQRYLDKSYYLVPADAVSEEPFAVIREALAGEKAAARASVVL